MRYLLIIFFALLASCSGKKEANIDSIKINITKVRFSLILGSQL